MNLGRLLARATIGGLFVGHGTQKLFGWFGGTGLDGTTTMMDNLELRPGRRNALAVSAVETLGGGLLAIGALTPVAASMITGSMVTAIRKVHYPKGLWNTGGGYEYNLALIAASAALVETGPGAPSVDRALGIERKGSRWALAALAAGAAGAALVMEAAERSQPEPERAGRFEREQQPIEAPETAAATR
jgi:putative oxidoreductase